MNTKTIKGRRDLQFNCENCLLADAEKIAALPDSYRALGNWSIGENFSHVAKTINASVNGFDFRVPLYLRVLGRVLRKKFLAKTFHAGIEFNVSAAKQIGPDQGISTADAFKQLQDAVALFQSTNKRAGSPIFGCLTAEQWVQMHARHAELHFSFIVPK